MEQMPLISVIVPVYRAEAYLDKCIASIVNQTHRNLEIILVDDGSPDRSGEICDAWARKDPRIRVIHQENAGGGPARNAGLDVARGALIAFVDSDDYISPEMYAHLYCLLTEEDADIAECGWRSTWDDGAVFTEFTKERASRQLYGAEEALALHIRGTTFRQLIWNKLYRRETVGNIRFPEGTKIDDEFFTWQVLAKAGKLVFSDAVCYAYRQQPDSVMHSLTAQRRLEGIRAKVLRQQYLRSHFPRLTELGAVDIGYSCLYQGQLALRQMEKAETEGLLPQLREVLRENQPAGKSVKDRIWLTLAKLSFRGTCLLRNLLKIGL